MQEEIARRLLLGKNERCSHLDSEQVCGNYLVKLL